jgi:hypothetical protein
MDNSTQTKDLHFLDIRSPSQDLCSSIIKVEFKVFFIEAACFGELIANDLIKSRFDRHAKTNRKENCCFLCPDFEDVHGTLKLGQTILSIQRMGEGPFREPPDEL